MKKTHWLRTTVIVLLVCGILGTALAAVLFKAEAEKPYVSVALQFTFDGAADGLAPNRQAFRIEEMERDDVLEAAISSAGLEGSITPDQIRGCFMARGTYPEDMLDQVMSYDSLMNFTANRTLTMTEFHPTMFDLKLVNGFDPALSEAQMNDLMDGIISAYREYFSSRYAYSTVTGTDIYDLDAYDYPQQLEILSESMRQSVRYAEELFEQNPTFLWKDTGFNDIAVRMSSLLNNDVDRLSAQIAMNALTRNTDRLRIQYQYEIQDLNIRLTQEQKLLTKLDALIASYEKNEIIYLSTSEELRRIDNNSSAVYDKLVDSRRTAADQITAIQAEIVDYQLRIEDLTEAEVPAEEITAAELTGDAETSETLPAASAETEAAQKAAAEDAAAKTAALEQNIDQVIAKRDAVIADLREMLDALNKQEINEDTIFVASRKYETPSLISAAFVIKIIKTAGPVCALGFMLCMILLIRSRRKEEKLQA